MTRRFLPLVPFALAIASVPVQAQAPWGDGYQDHCLAFTPENQIPWPTALGSPPNFGRMVVAYVDDDLDAEGVVVANGAAVVLWNVESYDAPEAITFPSAAPPVDVRDIAALTLGTIVDKDQLLMTDERGLLRVEFDPVTRTFLDPVVLSSAWADAAPIHADDLDGDGDLDVIGVASDKRQILRLIQDSTGPAPVFTPLATIPYPFDILDAIGVNWDGDAGGARETVALTRRGVIMFPLNYPSVPAVSQMYLAVTGCIARLRFEASNSERVAWTRPTSTPGEHELLVVGTNGIEGPWPLDFDFCESEGPGGPPPGPIVPTAILSGSFDPGGNDDLLLVHQGHRTAVILQNLESPVFDPTNELAYAVIPLAGGTVGTANVGIPAFTQLDHRNSDDLVVPVGGTAKVQVFLNLYDLLAEMAPAPNSSFVISDETEFGPGTSAYPHGTLRLAFEVPAAYEHAEYIDLVVFAQEDTNPPVWATHEAIYHYRHPLRPIEEPGSQYQWVEVRPEFPDEFEDGSFWSSPRPAYYVEFRFVHVEGTTVSRSPRFQGGFTLRNCINGEYPCGQEYSYLTPLGIPNTSFDLYDGADLEETPPTAFTGRTMVGSFVPMSSNPPFEPGSAPIRGEQLVGAIANFFAH